MAANTSDDEGATVVESHREFLDKDFFQSLVDNGSDAIVSIDEGSTILYANQAVEDVFGYEPADLVGQPLTTIMPKRYRDDHYEAIRRYVETGDRSLDWNDIQLPAVRADGTEIHLDITFEEHRYEGERVFSGIMRDVTERVERRERLRQQNERLERFASIVSHDLRDPLQSAKACVAIARDREDSEALSDLDARLDQMDELIDDVLTLAKQGEVVDESDPLDFESVARVAWETAKTDGGTLVVGDVGTTVGDENRVRRLLQNCFRNAVEHGGGDVTVEVGSLAPADGFYVADDGVGFDVEDTDVLFEHGRTSADDGTGFGLSIVESIAEAHGWTVVATASESGGARLEFHDTRERD